MTNPGQGSLLYYQVDNEIEKYKIHVLYFCVRIDYKYILTHLCHKNTVCFFRPAALIRNQPVLCQGRGAGVPTQRPWAAPHAFLSLSGQEFPGPSPAAAPGEVGGQGGGVGGAGERRWRMNPPLPQVKTCPWPLHPHIYHITSRCPKTFLENSVKFDRMWNVIVYELGDLNCKTAPRSICNKAAIFPGG